MAADRRPTRSPHPVTLFAAAAGLAMTACVAHSGTAQRPGEGAPLAAAASTLSETEIDLVRRGAAGEPMAVVRNDTPEGDAFLRATARPVAPADPALADLLARMQASAIAEQGVGIAAPQIGVSRRVVLVKRVDQDGEPFVAYLNPEIDRREGTVVDWEGCLSVPAGFGRVARAETIEVTYALPGTADGRARERVSGFAARIFQHEIDHLDGVLFIDRMEPGALVPEAEYRRMRDAEDAGGDGEPSP